MISLMPKFLCEDGHANETVARILAAPTLGSDECMCCVGARIWVALIVGFLLGVLF